MSNQGIPLNTCTGTLESSCPFSVSEAEIFIRGFSDHNRIVVRQSNYVKAVSALTEKVLTNAVALSKILFQFASFDITVSESEGTIFFYYSYFGEGCCKSISVSVYGDRFTFSGKEVELCDNREKLFSVTAEITRSSLKVLLVHELRSLLGKACGINSGYSLKNYSVKRRKRPYRTLDSTTLAEHLENMELKRHLLEVRDASTLAASASLEPRFFEPGLDYDFDCFEESYEDCCVDTGVLEYE